MDKPSLNDYLRRAKVLGVTPNFWLTNEYLSIQNITPMSNGKVIWIQEDDWAIFPPLPLQGELRDVSKDCPPMKIWSDFDNFTLGEPLEWLDWEYIYNAYDFQKMEGKRWAVFRKNSRKWPRDKNWKYNNTPPNNKQVEALLLKWLESKSPEEEMHDQESMMWFILNGSQRRFLFNRDKLVGINVYDWNFLHQTYMMYRYCITDPDEPFLNEFARLLFYQSMRGWLVIDGGGLGNPGLEKFKDKLNPIKKRAIYSKTIKGGK